MSESFYITTGIPYVNAKPHLGHVLEWFQADVLARLARQAGKDVAFVAGADENSLKNVQAAEKAGKNTQAWLDEYAGLFEQAYQDLNISLTSFRRGSDQKLHWPGVQELWKKCQPNIYKKTYTGLYCVGCEAFYTPEELIDGNCPEHMTKPELVTEENYFFQLSKYQDEILRLIKSNELKITSEQFRSEMLSFVEHGLEDFSISRSKDRGRGIGVPVPNDDTQVMYVWFDALSIYLTAIGWGYDQEIWQKYWPADVHVIGKGINRFHSVYWIGMLLAAGLPTPKAISVHGYLTADGQKMSKSLGNVIDPFELVTQYGLEPIRYYLLKCIPTHGDGDFSYERFRNVYNADLANGIGNLCSRVAKLCEKTSLENEVVDPQQALAATSLLNPAQKEYYLSQKAVLLEQFELDKTLDLIKTTFIDALDAYLATEKPWQLPEEKAHVILQNAVATLLFAASELEPFLPKTALTIHDHFAQTHIGAFPGLFPRLKE